MLTSTQLVAHLNNGSSFQLQQHVWCVAGRFNKHVDTWDAVQNQQYLSLEAVRHLMGQLATFSQAPKLDTPGYTVLRKPDGYEVRK